MTAFSSCQKVNVPSNYNVVYRTHLSSRFTLNVIYLEYENIHPLCLLWKYKLKKKYFNNFCV